MSRKENVHKLLKECANEVLGYIKETEHGYEDRWVPAETIKHALQLNMVTYPKGSKSQSPQGWVFAALVRLLEDDGLIEYRRVGARSYCRAVVR